jgi:Sucrase/ferredoxin-like
MPLSHAAAPGPTACSTASARYGEPLAGTAPYARRWLAVEQPGPWGPRALTESHLPQAVARALAARAEAAGVRIALIRRPGRHAEHDPQAPRRVFLADTRPGRSTLWSWETNDPATLLDLDFDVPAKPEHQGPAPLLVCTNSRRDECCALAGRGLTGRLAQDAAGEAGAEAVWESDHLGGHRFAPTAVLLPTGYLYGRLDAPAARAILRDAAAGRVTLDRCRGRSAWSRAGQAAELALRGQLQEFAPDAVEVVGERSLDPLPGAGTPSPDTHRYEVRLTCGGAAFRAEVAEAAAAEPRPESCGKAPGNPLELRVLRLEKDA